MLKTYEDTGKDHQAHLAESIYPQRQSKAFKENVLPQEAPESQGINPGFLFPSQYNKTAEGL